MNHETNQLVGKIHPLTAKRLNLFAQDEAIILMRTDCPVCRSEGLSSKSRVLIKSADCEIVATLYQVKNNWLASGQAGLSEAAWKRLDVAEGDAIRIRHAPTVSSLADVRRRIYGGRLDAKAFDAIINDIAKGRYVDIHLATFIAACSAFPLDLNEVIHLTRAMVSVGEKLSWDASMVLDKHCVGGLPGNRTTPIVVSILASLGYTVPKTSSRAITSPAGTADTMEALAPVDLDIAAIKRVVKAEGACLAWGGAVRLSPADDVLIRVERALDIDTEGQLIASVLSKKIAAGSTHVILDLPVGPTAKVRTQAAAQSLGDHLTAVASEFGLKARCLFTDGSQPVGRGIGPALEAYDVLAVLQNKDDAPQDLRRRALQLAGAAIELADGAAPGAGEALASNALDDGRAWKKFQAICEAQGGLRTPPRAQYTQVWTAERSGILTLIDNRKISRLAKLAGAPDRKAAGILMHVGLGEEIVAGQPLFTLHAEAPGELAYALEYARANAELLEIKD
jgi:thymidine phosphorylase